MKIINKYCVIYSLITITFIITLLVTSISLAAVSKNDPEIISTTNGYMLILKEHNGKIAIFKDLNSNPVEILDVYVEYLPILDRVQLKEGIKVDSESQLNRLIEDYDG